MATPKELRNELLGKTLVENLEKRHFEAYYCPTAAEALEKAVSLIPEKSSVSWGGSTTIREMGLTKALHEGDYEVIDRDLGKNPAEIAELHRKGLLVDYYLTSTNAISEDGIMVNIDGTGNRVAAICFGPKNVIVICGMNKVAKDVDAAGKRIRGYATACVLWAKHPAQPQADATTALPKNVSAMKSSLHAFAAPLRESK